MVASEGIAGPARVVQNLASVSEPPAKPRPFGAVIRDLLIEHGIVTGIGNPNWMDFSHRLKDVSYESLRKAVTGERVVGVKIMEACAEALGVAPDIFWEYQLAQVQREFDPGEVGDDVAFANLQAWLAAQSKNEGKAKRR